MNRSSISPWWQDRFLLVAVALFVAGHVLLALLVPDGADRMLVGDRAGDRFRALTQLVAQPDLDGMLRVMFAVGSPGDWILFAPAFALGGRYGVMAQNILLYAAGLVALYRLASLLVDQRTARLAVIAWVLLPATLFHPHALVSEAICNPLLIMLLHRLARMELAADGQWRDIVIAGLLTAVIAFVRHVYLLLPLAVALWLIVFKPLGLGTERRSRIAVFLLLGYVLNLAWWGTIAIGSRRYELAESVGGLESNLFLRADRMAAMGGLPMPQSYLDRNAALGKETRTLLPVEFVAFAGAHPALFVKSAISDAFNLMANPGVAMLAGRYLGLFDLGERNHRDLNKWREARERDGIMGVVRLLWQTSPTGLVFNVAGSILWAGFLAAAIAGAWSFARDPHVMPALKALLFGLAAYGITLTSAMAGYTRWDHRSAIEFILAIWFAVGVGWLLAVARDRLARLRAA